MLSRVSGTSSGAAAVYGVEITIVPAVMSAVIVCWSQVPVGHGDAVMTTGMVALLDPE